MAGLRRSAWLMALGVGIGGLGISSSGCNSPRDRPSAGAPSSDTTGEAGGTSSESTPLPTGSTEYREIISLVDAAAAEALAVSLTATDARSDTGTAGLEPAIDLFYRYYLDEYDFIVFALEDDGSAGATGVFRSVNRPPMIGTGNEAPRLDQEFSCFSRLKGVIGLRITAPLTAPPLAHELMHLWGNYLDPELGFGADAMRDYPEHWGVTSVAGQLGGWDAASLECETPAGAQPPDCTPTSAGSYRYLVAPFSPTSSPTGNEPYAPLELYLMGLIPASDVPEPILAFDAPGSDVEALETSAEGKVVVEAFGIREISMDEIIARHGERQLLEDAERDVKVAFVLLGTRPASTELLNVYADFADVFSGKAPTETAAARALVSEAGVDAVLAELSSPADGPCHSFAEYTSQLANLEAAVGARRPGGDAGLSGASFHQECDPYAQDCADGSGCYGMSGLYCLPAGTRQVDDPCLTDDECAPGLVCALVPASINRWICAPYCEPSSEQNANSCALLCPGGHTLMYGSEPSAPVAAYCHGGSARACDPLLQDCPDGKVCTGQDIASCEIPGCEVRGQICVEGAGTVCEAGSTCIGLAGAPTDFCQPYCDPSSTAPAELACSSLCPQGAWEFGTYAICMPDD